MASKNSSKIQFPEIELSSYEPVEITLKRNVITEEDIQERMRHNANSFGLSYKNSRRKTVKEDDIVEFDLAVDLNGQNIPNLTGNKRMLDLSMPMMPESFTQNIIGMKVGEQKEFEFDAPGSASLDDMNAQTTFHAQVSILAIKEKVEPEITDEWVKQYIPFVNSVKEFYEQCKSEIQSEFNQFVQNEKITQAANKLAERFQGSIGDELYQQVIDDMRKSYEEQARSVGKSLEDMLKEQGSSMQQFTMMLMMQARQTVRQGLSLDAWARHYNLPVKDNDINMMLETMYPGQGQEALKKLQENPEQKEGLEIAARRYIANMDVVAKAQVTYVD